MHKISLKYLYTFGIINIFLLSSSVYCAVQTSALGKLRGKLEHAAFKHMLLPGYCAWHNLKNTELSCADVLAVGTAAGACYGFKKINDRTQHYIVDGIKHGITRGCAAGKDMLGYMLDNKAKTAAGIGVVGTLWCLFKAVRADIMHNAVNIENFFSLLTQEQRATLLASDILILLVKQAQSNPACLLDSQVFMNLLTKGQKECLEKVIEAQSC